MPSNIPPTPQFPQMPQRPPNNVPIIGQRQDQQRAGILQVVQQLSIGIYSQLATSHIATVDRPHQEPDRLHLQLLARDAQVAAQAYFEGLGVAQFTPPPNAAGATPGPSPSTPPD